MCYNNELNQFEQFIIDQIKKYFENKAKLELKNVGCCPCEFHLEPVEPEGKIILTEDEFNEFCNFLKKLGLLEFDAFEHQVATKKYYCRKSFKTKDNSIQHLLVICTKLDNDRILYQINGMGIKFKVKRMRKKK